MFIFLTFASKIQKALRACVDKCGKVSLLVTLGVLLPACSIRSPELAVNKPSGNQHSVRVSTYNVFTGAHDPLLTAKAIRQMHADVVMLQELSPQGAKLLDQALKVDFPHRHFSEGVAILSRFPLRNPRYEHSQHGINGYLFAEVQSPGGRFQVASLHLDPLHLWTTRDKWLLPMQLLWSQDCVHREEVRQIVSRLRPGIPTILAGDFNSVSGVPIRRLQELGYTDSFAMVNKHPEQTPTLHFKLFGFRTGRRIDYIFHDASFQTLQSQVLHGAPSDHDSVVSVLEWK
ncbi:MAG: endonuclease/exonuclease/phosphatase family protein [Verrucomicrobiota bacterium]